MRRKYHHYTTWEEYRAGMWSGVMGKKRAELLREAVIFTGDHELYGSWMRKVIVQWPISCEHNLTDLSQNRQAWVGHAAVAMARSIPEDIVREAWGLLTDEQRRLANLQADRAIESWEKAHNEAQCQSAQLELTF